MVRKPRPRTHLASLTRAVAGVLVATLLPAAMGCTDAEQPPLAAATAHPATGSPSAASPLSQPTIETPAIEAPGSDDHAAPPPAAPAGQAPDAATAFAQAWVRDLPADQWLGQIAPLCEPGFAARLATVDPASIPASRITGPPIAVSPLTGGVVTYTIATDTGTLSVTIAAVAGQWLATSNDFTRSTR